MTANDIISLAITVVQNGWTIEEAYQHFTQPDRPKMSSAECARHASAPESRSCEPELVRGSAAESTTGYGRTMKRQDGEQEGCQCPDCLLPPQGPPHDLRQLAVPAWHGRPLEGLDGTVESTDHTKVFASGPESGLESGLILANHVCKVRLRHL